MSLMLSSVMYEVTTLIAGGGRRLEKGERGMEKGFDTNAVMDSPHN